MSGVKGRSGRRKDRQTVLKETLNSIEVNDLPAILHEMALKARAGDKDLQIYLCDRILGRPRQEIDSRVKAILYQPDDYITAIKEVQVEEQQLLSSPSDDTTSV